MIPFNFAYYKPSSTAEAVQIYSTLSAQGKSIFYISGATELITFGRTGSISTDAVIDLKGIPECHTFTREGAEWTIGSAITLNQIVTTMPDSLLAKSVRLIADHTSRNKITLGGNMNSRLIYRESVLPLLLTESKLKIAGEQGARTVPIREVFNKQLQLKPGEFVVQVLVDASDMLLPHVVIKKTKQSKIDYPIVTLAAMKKHDKVRFAFSTVCEYPFRDDGMEEVLNDAGVSKEQRIASAISSLPSAIVDDLQASPEYRKFVLTNTLQDALDALEGTP